MKLLDLLQPLIHFNYTANKNPTITSLEMDSRKVKQGSLFICIKGYTVDGHDFVTQAIENGAVAIIAEKKVAASVPVILVRDTKRAMAMLANHFYDFPTTKFPLIGVTGTNGKTTTTHLLEKIFQDQGKKTGLIGTMYSKIGEKTYETKNTTPESLELQKMFAEMVEQSVDVAVMEVSSHALTLGRVRGCDFNIAVFTNLTPDHLDFHQTMQEYLYAKGLLFAQLGNALNEKKIAIFNNDDPASAMYDKMTTAQVITYGIEKESDVMASNISITAKGTTFQLQAFDYLATVHLKLIGKFSVYNALAAIATCLASGVSLPTIINSLEQMEGVPGRFETIDAGQSFTVIVDYAHTPDSLENVLKTVKEFAIGRIICVVGCGGDRDRTKRPEMAKIAVAEADETIFTSDNPRTEDPSEILKEMEEGVKGATFQSIVDRAAAIERAISLAQQNDVVIIAGKGHETYQIIGKEVFDFDDRLVAKKAIEERLK